MGSYVWYDGLFCLGLIDVVVGGLVSYVMVNCLRRWFEEVNVDMVKC